MSMKFNPVHEMVHASVNTPTTTRFLKVTINDINGAYFMDASNRVLDEGSFLVIRVSRTLF